MPLAMTSADPANPLPPKTDAASHRPESDALDEAAAGPASGLMDAFSNHKGKLAVGAAAMLGLAVFYKWRESRLAKEDPEEYARLQRLKAAVDADKTEN